jgi:hypothetical protein
MNVDSSWSYCSGHCRGAFELRVRNSEITDPRSGIGLCWVAYSTVDWHEFESVKRPLLTSVIVIVQAIAALQGAMVRGCRNQPQRRVGTFSRNRGNADGEYKRRGVEIVQTRIAAMRGESDKLHPSSIPIASANPPRIQFLDSCVQWP